MIVFGMELLVLGFIDISLLATGSYPNVLVSQRENNKLCYYNAYQSHVGPAFVSLLVGIALVGVGGHLPPSKGRGTLEMESEIENRAIFFEAPSLWIAIVNFIVMSVVYGFGNPSLFNIWYVHQIFEAAGFCLLGYWWGSMCSVINLQEKVSSTIVWLICIVAGVSTMTVLGFNTLILIQILLITLPFPVGYYFNRFFQLKSRRIKTRILGRLNTLKDYLSSLR